MYVSMHFTPIYSLCFYNAFFLSPQRIKSWCQDQNACDLLFLPLGICLGKAEGENRKREVKQGRRLVFHTPGPTYGRKKM